MKKIISTLSIVTIAFLSMSFINPVKESSFKVDVQKSNIAWNGKKVAGQHSGNIKLTGGTLNLNDGKLSNGSFNINMNSILFHLSQYLKSGNFNLSIVNTLIVSHFATKFSKKSVSTIDIHAAVISYFFNWMLVCVAEPEPVAATAKMVPVVKP
jgi:hypothetical protein